MEKPPSRFIIGIDLGTTNCAVAYVDTHASPKSVQVFQVEQIVDWSMLERRDTLPSFHYQLTDQESASMQHRWVERPVSAAKGKVAGPYIVGVLARDRGLEMPGRQVASAKSWLCHAGVDRTAAMLPWHGDDDVSLLSPVEVSAAYLRHIRLNWDALHPHEPMADQEVVLTLPASFDEVARELTMEGARLAGLQKVFLTRRAAGCILLLVAAKWGRLVEQDQARTVGPRMRYWGRGQRT